MGRVRRGITREKRAKQAGTKGRYELLEHRKAIASAKGRTTKQLKLGDSGLDYRPTASLIEGQVLKRGVIGMGTRAVAPDWMMEKLHKMDPRYLQGMYESNRLLFEVFYSYEGIEFYNGVYVAGDEKLEDIELLIREYERLYGTIR